jgi:hypothetical protein
MRAGFTTAAEIKAAYRLGKIADAAELSPRGFDGYLDRIIAKVFDFAVDPKLAEMNEKHHVVLHGGRSKILTWEDDEIDPGRLVPAYQSPADWKFFHNKYRHTYEVTRPTPKKITKKVGNWWLEQRHRRQYEGLIYAPGNNAAVIGNKLNLWTGFTVIPAPGDCDLYLAHLKDNVCRGNARDFAYLIGWQAYAVQHPQRIGETSWVMRGKKGVGKNVAAEEFGKLFGQHFLIVLDAKHFAGHFNFHLQHCSVLLADECLFAGNPQHENIAKGLITGSTLFIEPKGINGYSCRNFLHVILCTNSAWAVPATSDERRWFVLDVGEDHREHFEYFRAIRHQMDNGGRAALLHYLKNLDLTQHMVGDKVFEVRDPPKTDALRAQQARTRRGVDLLVESWLHERVLPFSMDDRPNVILTSGDNTFDNWVATKAPIDLKMLGPIKIKNELRRDWGTKAWDGRSGGLHFAGIEVPAPDVLRALFVAKHGPQDWHAGEFSAWGSVVKKVLITRRA